MIMKKYSSLALVAIFASTLTSCELVEGIFKAGVWTGIIVVVVVLALIIWLVSKVFGGRD
jgi:cytosine/uracil/thiamine/allantoin permease